MTYRKRKNHRGKTLDTKDGFKVIDCIWCGFKHISPLFSDAELRTFYEKEFYQAEKPNYFKEVKEDIEWWGATYNNYYTLLEKHTKGRKLLDVGSGPGYFLSVGKKRGWSVLGIEPSPQAYAYSKRHGLPVIHDFFNYKAVKDYKPFDVVHMSLVLEHVPDPVLFIKDMKKLLKSNGLLFIVSPNDYSPLQNILCEELKFKPWWVVPKHHLNYFDFQSIKKLLTRHGFKIVDTLATFPMEFFLLSGDNYVGNHTLGRKCHNRRKKFEMNLYKKSPELLNGIYRDLAQNGVGREFVVVAQWK